jgi:hypothetical protein
MQELNISEVDEVAGGWVWLVFAAGMLYSSAVY